MESTSSDDDLPLSAIYERSQAALDKCKFQGQDPPRLRRSEEGPSLPSSVEGARTPSGLDDPQTEGRVVRSSRGRAKVLLDDSESGDSRRDMQHGPGTSSDEDATPSTRHSARQESKRRRVSLRIRGAQRGGVGGSARPPVARRRSKLLADCSSDSGSDVDTDQEPEGSPGSGTSGRSDESGRSWIQVGVRVEGRWAEDGELYPGEVVGLTASARQASVRFDDGDQQITDFADLVPEGTTPRCTSKKDEITDEDLRRRHVCWCSPDGSFRMCFNLSTLRKVALSMDQEAAVPDWKQPPHFRTPMGPSLRKQIACRWGGAGILNLSIESLGGDDFQRRFYKWAQGRMGSSHLFACPICYSWLLDGLEGSTKDRDPVTVLGSSEQGKPGAAHLCFSTKKAVVSHLEEAHSVSASIRQHGSVLERFSVRSSDGLLQRWLSSEGFTDSRAMHRFWGEGHAVTFLAMHDLARAVAEGSPTDVPRPFPERKYRSQSRKAWREACLLGDDSTSDEADGSGGSFIAEDGEEEDESDRAEDSGPSPCGAAGSDEDDPTALLRRMSSRKARRLTSPDSCSSSADSGSRGAPAEVVELDGANDSDSSEAVEYESEPDALDLAENPSLRKQRGRRGRLRHKDDSSSRVDPPEAEDARTEAPGGGCESESDVPIHGVRRRGQGRGGGPRRRQAATKALEDSSSDND